MKQYISNHYHFFFDFAPILGPITFGGNLHSSAVGSSSSNSFSSSSTGTSAATMAASLRRSNRLLSAAPYHASMRIHNRNQRGTGGSGIGGAQQQPQQQQQANDHEDESSKMDTSGMSSTAKIILDTLEKMSTPIRDAQKIPMASARAEKRRAIADQLLERPPGGGGGGSAGSSPNSIGSGSSSVAANYARRRPRLGRMTPGRMTPGTGASLLNGPPLRKVYSPVDSSAACNRRMGASSANNSMGSGPRVWSYGAKTIPSSSKVAFSSDSSTAVKSTGTSLQFSVPTLSKASKAPQLEQPTPMSSGKIRAKVGEKAKMRAEKAFFDDADGSEREEAPPHLKNASETINPFLKMNSLPKFSFGVGGQNKKTEEKAAPNKPHEFSSYGMSNDVAQSKLPAASPIKSSSPGRLENNTSSSFSSSLSPSSSKQALLDTSRELLTSAAVNASNADTPVKKVKRAAAAAEDTLRPLSAFVFSRPVSVPHFNASNDANLAAGANCFSYGFSLPAKVKSSLTDLGSGSAAVVTTQMPPPITSTSSSPLSSSPLSSSISPSRGNNLPDLTRGGKKSLVGAGEREGESRPFGLNAAGQLKTGSIMDILGAGE